MSKLGRIVTNNEFYVLWNLKYLGGVWWFVIKAWMKPNGTKLHLIPCQGFMGQNHIDSLIDCTVRTVVLVVGVLS